MKRKKWFVLPVALVSVTLACTCALTEGILAGQDGEGTAEEKSEPDESEESPSDSSPEAEPTVAEEEPADEPVTGLILPVPEGIHPENVSEVSFYASEAGALLVNGMVENTESEPIDFIFVTVSLYDGEGQLMIEAQGTSLVNPQPGEKAPFTVIFDLMNTSGFETYEIALDWDNLLVYYTEFEIVASQSQPAEIQGVNVSGTVANSGSQTAKNVRVVAVLYDANDNILTVPFTYPEVGDVPPGESFDFSMDDFFIDFEEFDHFELYVQATLI